MRMGDLVLVCGCGDVYCGFERACPAVPASSRHSLLALLLLLGTAAIFHLRHRIS